VEQPDWPLMLVFLLAVLSITLILQALRAAAQLMTRLYLKLRIWRRSRLHASLFGEAKQKAPMEPESVLPYARLANVVQRTAASVAEHPGDSLPVFSLGIYQLPGIPNASPSL
jgi:hypothetical protein